MLTIKKNTVAVEGRKQNFLVWKFRLWRPQRLYGIYANVTFSPPYSRKQKEAPLTGRGICCLFIVIFHQFSKTISL